VAIDDFTVVGKRLEAVSKSFGDKKGPAVIGRKTFAIPVKIGGRLRPHVHRHIENLAADAGNEPYRHVGRSLVVEAADRATAHGD
jgi:hypothetical protein